MSPCEHACKPLFSFGAVAVNSTNNCRTCYSVKRVAGCAASKIAISLAFVAVLWLWVIPFYIPTPFVPFQGKNILQSIFCKKKLLFVLLA